MEDQRLLQLVELIAQANREQNYALKLPTSGKNDSVDLISKEVTHLLNRLSSEMEARGSAPEGEIYFLLDDQQIIRSANAEVWEALGHQEQDILGQPLASFLHEQSPGVDELLQETSKQQFSGLRLAMVHAQGHAVLLPVTASILTQPDGAKYTLVAGLHEAQKMPREGERTSRQVQRLTSFLHKTASEFKGPISSISGVVNLAKLESQDFKQHRYLDLVNKTVRQMDTIIRNIVTFCGNMEDAVEVEKIDLALEITHILRDLRSLEGAEMIKYNLNVDPNLSFHSDPWRIQIILSNLISNAIKYQNLDQEYPTINIMAKPWEGGVEMIVKDNGPGIAREYQESIFDMFFKATDKPQGAGLGLFITRSVVEKLGGHISLESKTREGSSFIVRLPQLSKPKV